MIEINKDLCTGCQKCIRDCISRCITLADGKAEVTKECFLCGHCVAVCPATAVSNPHYNMDEVESWDKDAFSLNPATLLRAVKFRRSIRDYRPGPVEEEKLRMILEAGRYTATAKNNQDSHFIFVQKELDTLKKYVWDFIEAYASLPARKVPREMIPFLSFLRRKKENKADDYLFRNAPAVVFITSDWPLDAGLAAQNMELMAVSLGLGVLYNGFLARISDSNEALKAWLGIEGKPIKACMLLGYPNVSYARTAPRRDANVIWK